MQPWLATLIGAGVVVLINLLTASYVYGKLTQTVATHETRLNAHSGRLDDHTERISNLEGWRDGKAARAHHV
jgi:hypothetical protein